MEAISFTFPTPLLADLTLGVRLSMTEPITFIIPAIIILSVLLIVLLVYTIRQFNRDKRIRDELQSRAAAPERTPERTPAPRSSPTPAPPSDPMLQQARRALESATPGDDARAASKITPEPLRTPLRADDQTPPAGNPRVELSNLLDSREPAPRWLNDTLAAAPEGRSSSATTNPQPALSSAELAPAAPAPIAGDGATPPRKATVALARPFFDESADATAAATAQPAQSPSPSVAPSAREEENILSMLTPNAGPAANRAPAPAPATTRPNPAQPAPLRTPPITRPAPPPREPSPARAAMAAALNRPLTSAIPKLPELTPAQQAAAANTARFRDQKLPAAQRLEAFQTLLRDSETEERVLLIVEAMNDDELEIQLVALQEINARSSGALLDEVIPLIDAPSAKVAVAAIKALENIGGPVVEQSLLAALDHTSANVRAEAERALIASANPALEDQLRDLISEENAEHVASVARVLAALGGSENAEFLQTRASIETRDPSLRATLETLAQQARTTERTSALDASPFAGAEEVEFRHSDLDEFSLSLDPEIFNIKD